MNEKEVDALTIQDLRVALKRAGLQSGPITGSTEAVYRAALCKHLLGLDYKTEQVSLPNPTLEDFDNAPALANETSETETNNSGPDEANEFPVDINSSKLSSGIVQPKGRSTPVRWNYKLQRYEPLYDDSGELLSESRNEGKADCQWVLLLAVIAVFMAIVIAVLIMSQESDPYKGLEDAASQVAKSPGKVVVEP